MTVLLAIAPLLLLIAALCLGHYPGVELIERIAERLAQPPGRRSSPSSPRRQAPCLTQLVLVLLATARPLRGPPSLLTV